MKHALHRILLLQLLTTLGLHGNVPTCGYLSLFYTCSINSSFFSALGSEIINGKKVPDNKMLFMASVQNSRNKHICGGFLINKDFVVTAAHCDVWNTSVVLGTHNLKKIDDTMRYSVKRCKHPSYEEVDKFHKNRKATRRNTTSRPCKEVKENEKCQVAGWGPEKNDGSDPVDQLNVVDVTVISQKACKDQIPELGANAICTGGKQTLDNGGFCKSDAGGPLVCKGKAVGIATVNDNCSFPGLPNFYVDISKYRSWINACIKEKKCY
ncbi:hypothetical protein KUCAC02_023239 [Chaenocephalus aceratus]|uniref:Uncharacterized protein n=1 Tax=Chaenocephalus aceratus TaxID=36190 RepID=A0ACB9XRF5_CHAAC|nr:hypothetical protein KUCAC02_023239 [Chaenocephalus aceratus]